MSAQLHTNLLLSSEKYVSYDEYLESNYVFGTANARELREYLLGNLESQGINPDEFNREGGDKIVDNPPVEIYEYQLFFLMRKENGDLILLDGFRRLLWYNSPNHRINVRVYNEDELSSQQIMKLLIYLNHFKFYGSSGKYFDRGFALGMYTIFGLNIPKYYNTFNAYLTLSDTEKKYWGESITDTQENLSVKERMLNPMFISDMKFIEGFIGTDVMLTPIMGALIYKTRLEHPDKEFSSEFFLSKVNENEIIKKLHEKFHKAGDGNSVESQKIVNQIIPLYKNIFNEMLCGEITLTYAEKKDEVKKLVEQLKKDKTYTKLTGSKSAYLMEWIMEDRIKNNQPINFKCVIHPKEPNPYRWNRSDNNNIPLEHGLLKYEVKVLGKTKGKSHLSLELKIGFVDETEREFVFRHNYGDWSSYGKKYTTTDGGGLPNITYDVDLFVDITKAEIEYKDKNRR
jgi:hypothetical protein